MKLCYFVLPVIASVLALVS